MVLECRCVGVLSLVVCSGTVASMPRWPLLNEIVDQTSSSSYVVSVRVSSMSMVKRFVVLWSSVVAAVDGLIVIDGLRFVGEGRVSCFLY